MATIRRTLRSRAWIAVRLRREVQGDVADPDPVDPALQHRRLAAPPRRVDEHELLAPLEVGGVAGDGRIGSRLEVAVALLGAQHRVEAGGVQVRRPGPRRRGPAARRRPGRAPPRGTTPGRGGSGRAACARASPPDPGGGGPSSARRGRGTPARSASPWVSIEYSPSHVVGVRSPQFSRSARVSIRRPPSCISLTYVHGAPYVLTPTMRRTLDSAGRTLPCSSNVKATPATITRSSQPRSIAGGPLHHVG